MAARRRRRRPRTPNRDRDLIYGLTGTELLGYVLIVAACVAIGWALVLLH